MLSVLSVSEFVEQVNGLLAGIFTVEGEVSHYTISQGKWVFFDIKDSGATLNCFASVFQLLTKLEDGMKVRVTGYPSIYAKSGRFSFTVQHVELVGTGSLKRAYELLKAQLDAEGLFAVERKRQLPHFPHTIGVIASRDSAAFGDFKRILANRWGGVELVLRHVAVQGDSAVADIVRAFQEFNAHKDSFDAIALIRGGGSLEDLAAFNSEAVVRAVYGSRVPVVVGVGHERDESLADFAADMRASTPSHAAELLVPDRKEFFREMEFSAQRMQTALEHRLRLLSNAVEDANSTIQVLLESGVSARRSFVRSADTLLKNVDPRAVLTRGYSIVRDAKGTIIRSARQVDIGERIVVELAQGKLAATTIDTEYSMPSKPKSNFTTRYEELQKIVAWFEKDSFDLEEGITKFEQGSALVSDLKKYLDTVENKIVNLKTKTED